MTNELIAPRAGIRIDWNDLKDIEIYMRKYCTDANVRKAWCEITDQGADRGYSIDWRRIPKRDRTRLFRISDKHRKTLVGKA